MSYRFIAFLPGKAGSVVSKVSFFSPMYCFIPCRGMFFQVIAIIRMRTWRKAETR